MKKLCLKCNIEKDISEFHFRKDTLSFRWHCNDCRKEHNKIYLKAKPWKAVLYNIQRRCEYPNDASYKYYGGRGIQCLITEDEIKYLWFRDRAWELSKPSIDRIDNDGNYCLENCQFIEVGDNVRKRFASRN